MSVPDDTILTSSGEVTLTSMRAKAIPLARVPGHASPVPVVRCVDVCTGGLHDSAASGAPCWRFAGGALFGHALYARASDTRNGVAPFGRGWVADAAPTISIETAITPASVSAPRLHLPFIKLLP